jgi:hypothetical protein
LLAQLTAIKTMLLQRRDRLDLALLQQPLQEAQQAITRALKRGGPQQAPAGAPNEERGPMLALPDVPERDLTPWVQRRLQLAVDIARELQADAARAVPQ